MTKVDDEYVFGGTATGLISLHVNADGLISFSRGGITVKTTLDISVWAIGSDFIRVGAGQTLVVRPEHVSLLAGDLAC